MSQAPAEECQLPVQTVVTFRKKMIIELEDIECGTTTNKFDYILTLFNYSPVSLERYLFCV